LSFEAERARIETHFRDQWALTSYAATVPVIFENTSVQQPHGDFLLHRIASGDGTLTEIAGAGPALHRYVGIVQIDILAVSGTGSANSRKYADAIATAFRRQQIVDTAGGIITFRAPSMRAMGAVGERSRTVMTVPFIRDIRH
jgi:hypothetical protein